MSGPSLMCSLHRYLNHSKAESQEQKEGSDSRQNGRRKNLLGGFAVGELVVGQLLPVGQAGVNVVEDVEVPLASGESSDLA